MLKCPTKMDTSSDLKVESNMIKEKTEAIPKSHQHMPPHSRLLKSEKCHEKNWALWQVFSGSMFETTITQKDIYKKVIT